MVALSDRQAPPPKGSPDGNTAVHAAITRDIDEQAALLRGWNQTYDQISAGAFSGSFWEARIDDVQFFREITSNSLHQTGDLPEGTIAVGVPIALRGNARFCGQRCDGAQVHVFSGNDAFEFFSPSGLDIAGFVLREQDLRCSLTSDELETVLPSLANPHLRAVDGSAAEHMRRIFADVCEVVTNCPDLENDAPRRASMTRDVRAALVAALSRTENDSFDVPSAKRARIVRDARDLVTESPDGYTSVEELCRTLGVSRRALQQSFQETLGLKPSAYLRSLRMNGARRAIKQANSVAEAATLWGFWHFGRFARDYKVMFGELPSEAFRRYHGPAEAGEP
ncbi:MAG: helix-turn-helix domain-containing protein [Hyphomicrobium zavarzinii]|uniref:helix-turn-helix domain-containing protein n=1 Tax=Hyphomicrobium zavarzinii TaxID=48292 RepID=UPI001A4FF7EF|nr:helix-turn-helix domain-containing protein [Hyphomicrobium zavarzinii]MBL8847444.1 helix-turn-helix domain-containing protein [Hyphomicrobium zavarzinii]